MARRWGCTARKGLSPGSPLSQLQQAAAAWMTWCWHARSSMSAASGGPRSAPGRTTCSPAWRSWRRGCCGRIRRRGSASSWASSTPTGATSGAGSGRAISAASSSCAGGLRCWMQTAPAATCWCAQDMLASWQCSRIRTGGRTASRCRPAVGLGLRGSAAAVAGPGARQPADAAGCQGAAAAPASFSRGGGRSSRPARSAPQHVPAAYGPGGALHPQQLQEAQGHR